MILTNEVNPSDESIRDAETSTGTTEENTAVVTPIPIEEHSSSEDHLANAVNVIDKTVKIINAFCIWC